MKRVHQKVSTSIHKTLQRYVDQYFTNQGGTPYLRTLHDGPGDEPARAGKDAKRMLRRK